MSRTRLETDVRRQQLLELGLTLFSSQSYEDVSIADIARMAKVSKGLLYHYFGGKRDFYVACVEMAAQQLADAIMTNPEEPGIARARAGLSAYLDYVEARADAYLALMHGGLGADVAVIGILERTREAIIEEIMQGLGLASPRPAFRMAARSWLGAVEAASLDWLHKRDVTKDYVLEQCLATMVVHFAVAMKHDPEAGVERDEAWQALFLELLR